MQTNRMWASSHTPTRLRVAVCMMLVLAVLFGGTALVYGQTPEPQARALWVVRGDMYNRSSIDYMIRLSKALGANMLVLQVTQSGTTIINSDLYPRAAQVPDGFDPLAYAIERAHAEGMEVHAWINAIVLSGFGSRPTDPMHVVNRAPELITYTHDGRSLTEMIGWLSDRIPNDLAGLMLEPTLPAVRELVAKHAAEVVAQYDVDGIHLDYIRYAGRSYGYNPETRAAFKQLYGYDPMDFAAPVAADFAKEHGLPLRAQLERQWDEYRRDAVTQIVLDVYDEVTAIKPWVAVSASVFANHTDAFQHRFQDWPMWLRNGYIDIAFPMAYNGNPLVVRSQIGVAMASANVGQRHVIAGLGSYVVQDDRERVTQMLADVEELGAQGFALFSYQSIVSHLGTFTLMRELLGEGEVPPVPARPWKPERPR